MHQPKDTPKAMVGPDRLPLTEEAQAKLNESVHLTFSTAAGRETLDWLQRITVNRVMEGTASDGELRQQEGMRQLFSLIKDRMARHEHTKKGQ